MRFETDSLRLNRAAGAAAALAIALILSHGASAGTSICPRPAASTDVLPPPDLYSSNGTLDVALNYNTTVDEANRTLFCFQTPDGTESPTFHVNPGDTINIDMTNTVPPVGAGPAEVDADRSKQCGNAAMTLSSSNMHFHGINTSPKCHSDEVIHTLVNSGETFTYNIKVPKDEPPGLYWYHPHVHGVASAAVQGGASGVIVVEGIENIQPAVAGLPQRILIVRDQPLLNGAALKGPPEPNWDVSVNYVPVPYPNYPPAIINATQGTQEFWRVANASANTILDLQVIYDGKAQPLQIVGLDGVPTGSQDGKRQGTILTDKHILLAPAGRAEFIVTMPGKDVAQALFVTRAIDGGASSDSNPARPLAQIVATDKPVRLARIPAPSAPPNPQRFENLDSAKVTAERKLYFWEIGFPKGQKPEEQTLFFIVVDGEGAELYDPNDPPAIVTHKGAVEDWTIENHTTEVHEFHMHQIHFKLLEVNGVAVPKQRQQFYDTIQVPYWDGVSPTYPSVKVRMDFRGAVVGDFVYHCHILDHEDGGMMAIIRVKPPK
jgi:FtsP/CotA-like multicopper oxidase with cupredoxin domain